MKLRISSHLKDELVRGSIILFITFGLYNFINYLFQMSMARLLGPSDYGIFAALMSLIYLFSIPNEAIQTVVAKYTAIFNSKKSFGRTKDLLARSLKKGLLFSSVIFLIFLPISYYLSLFLKIHFSLIFLTSFHIFHVFLMPVNRGVLQGSKRFFNLGSNFVIESSIKLLVSISLVFLGFRVYGAIFAVILSGVLSFLLIFLSLKKVMCSKRIRENFGNIYKTNYSALIAVTAIVLMFSVDILLARRFFSPENAGIFAFVSLIGKIIFFLSSSTGKTMFSISAENVQKGKSNSGLFKKSLLIVAALSLFLLLVFLLFPEETIFIISLGASTYIEGSRILLLLGIAYSLLSFSNLIILYKISINNLKSTSSNIMILISLIQIPILWLFSSSLLSFSIGILLSNLIMFLYSLFLIRK